MPEPEPQSDEDRQEFVGRCVQDDVMIEDYPDINQRLAVCYDIYDEERQETNVDDMQYNEAGGHTINE